MDLPVLREVTLGTLEDWDIDDLMPVSRLSGLVESLTESWLKDRQRAVSKALMDTETYGSGGAA
jgi:hypothetical protein